jgi:hypothetical protein
MNTKIKLRNKSIVIKTPPRQTKFKFEYTDTFGGEANYSWVRRCEIEAPENISDLALMRRAKKWAGLTNVRGRSEDWGDSLAFYPRGSCTVLFINAEF